MSYLQDNPGDAEHRQSLQHRRRKSFHHISRKPVPQADRSTSDRVYELVKRHLGESHTEAALHALNGAPSGSTDIRLRNAKAVCLMRLGKPDRAVAMLRPLVLTSYVTLRPDVPLAARVNFATALFLTGKVTGCVDALREIDDESDPAVQTLRSAIECWKRELNWRERLVWLMGANPDHPVEADFTPGELI